MKTARVIAIANQKGGVGKTRTTMNMAYALADKEKRVLLVDFDPQGNLTMCFGIDRPEELECSISHLMMAVIEESVIPEKKKYILHKLSWRILNIGSSPFNLSVFVWSLTLSRFWGGTPLFAGEKPAYIKGYRL